MPSNHDRRRERLITELAQRLGVSRETIESRFPDLEGIALDSLDVTELVMELEEEFGDEWRKDT